MAVDKALNPAPMGLGGLEDLEDLEVFEGGDEPVLEVELPLSDEEMAEAELMDDEFDAAEDDEFNENLAEDMDEKVLETLSGDLLGEFDEDIASRKDWIQTYVDGLELLGLKIEDRSEPWPGACGVYHPLLSEALVKFQAETMMETFPAAGPVKTQIIGKETPEKKDSAERVQADMNYELTERMVEYRPEHERMLWGLGLAGNAFKKVYFDPSLGRQTSLFVPAEDIVVPYGASSLQTTPRLTHVMRKTPNEVKKLQRAGFYRDIELEEPSDTFDEVEKKIAEKLGFSASSDDRYKLLEMHVDLYLPDYADKEEKPKKKKGAAKTKPLDDEGIASPYVVTLEKGTGTILAIRRNWHPDDTRKLKRNHFVHYSYIPGFGFYAFGLIHLIGAFAKSGTSLIRQLVDAGTLSNLPGGFKTKGLRIKGDDTPVGPGEWRDVDVASGTMRDNIMPLPYKEPSQVLYALLGTIVDEGRRFASAADLKVSDMSAQSPVGTTLAILERTLKVMSAVQARIHYAMRQEFRLLKDIIRDYTPDEYAYEPDDGEPHAKKGDYDSVEVIPVSDPNAATMAQKVVQYQAVMQMAQGAPQLYNLPYLHRQMLEVLGIKNADKLIPMDDDLRPTDPVSENMNIINNKPVKAFLYQDHEAHIAVHMAAIQDPEIQQIVGQSPTAPAMMAAMAAHISEHVAFAYRKKIEDAAGVPYPAPDAEMSESLELDISRLAGAAASKVLQESQQKAAGKQAEQQAQDPIVQMQQVELQIKGKEVEIKEKDVLIKQQKLMVDVAEAKDRMDIDRERIASAERIAGLQVGAKVSTAKAQLESKDKLDGMRLGVEVARDTKQMEGQNADRAHNKNTSDRSHLMEVMKQLQTNQPQPVAPQTGPAKDEE